MRAPKVLITEMGKMGGGGGGACTERPGPSKRAISREWMAAEGAEPPAHNRKERAGSREHFPRAHKIIVDGGPRGGKADDTFVSAKGTVGGAMVPGGLRGASGIPAAGTPKLGASRPEVSSRKEIRVEF